MVSRLRPHCLVASITVRRSRARQLSVGLATDRAVILGLAGFLPESYDAERAEEAALRALAGRHGLDPVAAVEVLYHSPARRPLQVKVRGPRSVSTSQIGM